MRHISATTTVPAPPAVVLGFLRAAANHRRLATAPIRLRELHAGADGELHGAVLVIRGPLRVRRHARTRVETAGPRHLGGSARLHTGTVATVRWELSPAAPDGTDVTLSAAVTTAGAIDRLLLRAGGRRWAGRLLAATLDQLVAELAGAPRRGGRQPLRLSAASRSREARASPVGSVYAGPEPSISTVSNTATPRA